MGKEQSVLVTGAGGYIGRHVVKILLDAGVAVTAVDLNTDHIDLRAKKISRNIFTDNKEIYNELGRPDVCLHMAWKDGFIHNSISHMEILSEHFTFLHNIITSGLKHLAVMGSMHEVGYHEGEINSKTPTNPQSLYGVAKNALYQALFTVLTDRNDVVFQWLRAFYIYGDDINNHSVFTKILEAEKRGQKTFPLTKGVNKCDYITVEELAHQISASVMQTEVKGIINCCSGVPMPLKDIVQNFITANNLKIKLQLGAFPDRPYDSSEIWGNTDKITSIMKECKYNIISHGFQDPSSKAENMFLTRLAYVAH